MFSGLIEKTGRVVFQGRNKLGVALKSTQDKKGDSLAIDGVCLTITQIKKSKGSRIFYFDLLDETLKKTTLQNFKMRQIVNVERTLRLQDGLGGHIVQGHVDGVGRVRKIEVDRG